MAAYTEINADCMDWGACCFGTASKQWRLDSLRVHVPSIAKSLGTLHLSLSSKKWLRCGQGARLRIKHVMSNISIGKAGYFGTGNDFWSHN